MCAPPFLERWSQRAFMNLICKVEPIKVKVKVRSLKKWVGVKFPLNESQPKMRAFVHPSVQSANRIGYDKRKPFLTSKQSLNVL